MEVHREQHMRDRTDNIWTYGLLRVLLTMNVSHIVPSEPCLAYQMSSFILDTKKWMKMNEKPIYLLHLEEIFCLTIVLCAYADGENPDTCKNVNQHNLIIAFPVPLKKKKKNNKKKKKKKKKKKTLWPWLKL